MIYHAPMTTKSTLLGPLTSQPLLAERVYDTIKEAIFSLELDPGTQLVERDLASRLGVSKSPVRDALQRLAGEGLIVGSAYRGLVVRTIEPDEADEIYALREVLEAFAVELATPRLSAADIERGHEILARAERAIEREDRTALAAINREFHGLFAERSANRPLMSTLATVQDRVRIISVLGWRWRPTMREEYDQHQAVLAAAASGDTAEAVRRMRDHIHRFRVAYAEGWRDAHHGG